MSLPSIDNRNCWQWFSRLVNGVILVDLLLLSRSFWAVFGSRGFINEELMAHSGAPMTVFPLAAWLHLSVDSILTIFLILNVILACAGIRFGPRRGLGVAQYLIYLSFIQSISMGIYGMHEFLKIALFYLMLSSFFFKGETGEPPVFLGTALRAHLAVAYCAAGISKSLGIAWWSGDSVWRAVQRNDMSHWALINLSHVSLPTWIYVGVAWMTIFTEGLYPLGFFRKLMPMFVSLMIGMHLGTIVFQGLYLFGATMIIFNFFFFFHSRASQQILPVGSLEPAQIQ